MGISPELLAHGHAEGVTHACGQCYWRSNSICRLCPKPSDNIAPEHAQHDPLARPLTCDCRGRCGVRGHVGAHAWSPLLRQRAPPGQPPCQMLRPFADLCMHPHAHPVLQHRAPCKLVQAPCRHETNHTAPAYNSLHATHFACHSCTGPILLATRSMASQKRPSLRATSSRCTTTAFHSLKMPLRSQGTHAAGLCRWRLMWTS